jgi:hypothetical protein
MQTVLLLAGLACSFLVLAAHSSQESQPQTAPTPPAEIGRLSAWLGTWNAEIEMMGAKSTGTETCRMECNGYWLVTEFSGSFMGAPFQGRGFTGWDPVRGAYQGVWIDSTGSPMSYWTDGAFSKDGKVFRSNVEATDMDGKSARFEYRTTFESVNVRVFEIFQLGGEKQELVMRVRYTRK